MFGKIREILLFSNFSRSQLKKVMPQIMEENRRFCIIWSAIYDLFWVYCLFMTMRDPLYLQCRDIYIAALAASIVALVLSICITPKHTGLIRLTAILVDAILLLAGVFIARNLAPQTIVVFAAVLIVPVTFITDALSTVLLLLINVIVFTQVGSRSMDPDTYRWVLSNLCIFSVIGTMLGHFVNRARFERYILAESNAELAAVQTRNAHHDQLTDLQNRRSYAETIEQFPKELPADCHIIIADINGLKEMNDANGHDAGDELIIGAAECLRKSFAGTDKIFRMGGDEFCIIINGTDEEIQDSLNRLQEYCAHWKGKYINGISLSAGCASAAEFDNLDSIFKAADNRMYASKRSFYESSGRDRRRR